MGADEITVMATYSIAEREIEYMIELHRCTRYYAIQYIILQSKLIPSTIREITFDDNGVDYNE